MITTAWLTGSALIGVIAAWSAGRVVRGNGLGLLGNVIAAVLGAVVGGALLPAAGMNLGAGLPQRLVVSLIGAVLVLVLVHMFTGRRDGRRLWS